MWNLDDQTACARVLHFELPWAQTWADMREGHTDREKRERIRAIAAQALTSPLPVAKRWAIRIHVWKRGSRPFDIENVAKPIIDAFCLGQIQRDGSPHTRLGLYPDDRIDYVSMLQVAGERTDGADRTAVELFAHPPPLALGPDDARSINLKAEPA